MSWIKMRGSLMTNPKVICVARALLRDPEFLAWHFGGACNVPRDVTRNVTGDAAPSCDVTLAAANVTKALLPVVTRVTVGALLPLWSSVNECAADDAVLRSADADVIDAICGVPGMGRALNSVGWIDLLPNEDGVSFPNFHEHNTLGRQRGAGAKTGAERTREYRARKKRQGDATGVPSQPVTVTSHGDHREEKNREDISTDRSAGVSAGEVCKAMRAVGVADVNPGHVELLELLAAGATAAELVSAVTPGKGFVYALRTAKGRRADQAANPTVGRSPPRRASPPPGGKYAAAAAAIYDDDDDFPPSPTTNERNGVIDVEAHRVD